MGEKGGCNTVRHGLVCQCQYWKGGREPEQGVGGWCAARTGPQHTAQGPRHVSAKVFPYDRETKKEGFSFQLAPRATPAVSEQPATNISAQEMVRLFFSDSLDSSRFRALAPSQILFI